MPKKRVKVPREIADKVLKEYRHKCAMCGRPEPQLHHLDENPENNEPLNLLPLCPNCHLQDTHDPTSPPHPHKLRLFRIHKDPLILDPRFHPIFRRFMAIRDPDVIFSPYVFQRGVQVNDFLDFVRQFQMGEFYSNKLRFCIESPTSLYYAAFPESPPTAPQPASKIRITMTGPTEAERNYAIEQIESLTVELLRYQNWELRKPANSFGEK